jgi:hypothetical protein
MKTFFLLEKQNSNHSDNHLVVRYIRINLIKTNMKRVIKKLVKNGFQQIIYNKEETSFEE